MRTDVNKHRLLLVWMQTQINCLQQYAASLRRIFSGLPPHPVGTYLISTQTQTNLAPYERPRGLGRNHKQIEDSRGGGDDIKREEDTPVISFSPDGSPDESWSPWMQERMMGSVRKKTEGDP